MSKYELLNARDSKFRVVKLLILFKKDVKNLGFRKKINLFSKNNQKFDFERGSYPVYCETK
jgi:hypothetical protein